MGMCRTARAGERQLLKEAETLTARPAGSVSWYARKKQKVGV